MAAMPRRHRSICRIRRRVEQRVPQALGEGREDQQIEHRLAVSILAAPEIDRCVVDRGRRCCCRPGMPPDADRATDLCQHVARARSRDPRSASARPTVPTARPCRQRPSAPAPLPDAARRQHEELVRPRPDQQGAICLRPPAASPAPPCRRARCAGLGHGAPTGRAAPSPAPARNRVSSAIDEAGSAFLHAVAARRVDARQRRGGSPGELSHAGVLLPDRRRRDCRARPRSPRRAADRARWRSRRCARGRARRGPARSTGRASARSRPR